MHRKTNIQITFCGLVLFLLLTNMPGQAQVFFREHWAVFDKITHNNPNENRWRVNDAQLSLHPEFGVRTEAGNNGLMLINVPENLFQLSGADLYLELWGGHPLTANKRFILNGKETYFLPDDGVEADNCAYSYPLAPLKVEQMVTGINALQFACDRGQTFWGHFIIDNAAICCYLKADHPDVLAAGLQNFFATVDVGNGRVILDQAHLSLVLPTDFYSNIISVDYFGRYLGYDDEGNFREDDWHGYTQQRQFKNHLGHADKAPFDITWDTRMIPTQSKPMAVKALITFSNGFKYWTPVTDGLVFPTKRPPVMLFTCTEMPRPFWSRDKDEKTAEMLLPDDLTQVASAQLYVRIWDGGEGEIKEPFKINGFPYNITSGKAIHDVVFTVADVDPQHLKPGKNIFTLLSDTEHHGIEMLLPGPAVVLRYK